MRDAHQMIVDHIGQMVGRITIGFQQNEIPFGGIGIVFVVTVDEIFVDLRCLIVRR